MKHPYLATLSMTALLLATPTLAQIMPKSETATKPAVKTVQKSAQQSTQEPVLSLEDLFGITPEDAPATAESTESLKELLSATPEPIMEPTMEQTMAPIKMPSVAPVAAPAIKTIPDMSQQMQSVPTKAAAPLMNVPVMTVPAKPVVEIVDAQPTTAAPIEKVIVPKVDATEAMAQKSVVRTAPKKRQALTATPSMPTLLPSQLMKLEDAVQQSMASIPDAENLEMVRQLPSAALGNIKQPGVDMMLEPVAAPVMMTSTVGSVGSLNGLLSQQLNAIETVNNSGPALNLPNRSQVETFTVANNMDNNGAVPAAAPMQSDNLVSEDPLAALAEAIELQKQPMPSLSSGVVQMNTEMNTPPAAPAMGLEILPAPQTAPQIPLMEEVSKLPSAMVSAQPETLEEPVMPEMLPPITDPSITPIVTPSIAAEKAAPITYNQPDTLQTAGQRQAASDAAAFEPQFQPGGSGNRIESILFTPFHSNVDHHAQQKIADLADSLKNQSGNIVLNGYADWTNNGTMAATDYLAARRAISLKEQLVLQGIPAGRIAVVSKGLDLRGGMSKDRVDVLVEN